MLRDKIKELRNNKNITQNQLANAIGISKYAIAKYETGEREPSLDIVVKIANYFNVSTDYLLGNSEIENIDKYINNFKEYQEPIIKIIENVCSIADKKTKKIESVKVILSELNKLL